MELNRREALLALGAAVAGTSAAGAATAAPVEQKYFCPLTITEEYSDGRILSAERCYMPDEEMFWMKFVNNLGIGKVIQTALFKQKPFTFCVMPFCGSKMVQAHFAGPDLLERIPGKYVTSLKLYGINYKVESYSHYHKYYDTDGTLLAQDFDFFVDRPLVCPGR